jgi:hypothetical protein
MENIKFMNLTHQQQNMKLYEEIKNIKNEFRNLQYMFNATYTKLINQQNKFKYGFIFGTIFTITIKYFLD